MSDRHLHCVYFKYNSNDSLEGHCLLKDKGIQYGFKQSCDKCVLRPSSIISYYLKHNNYCDDWGCSDKKAIEYLKKTKFNDYPKEN